VDEHPCPIFVEIDDVPGFDFDPSEPRGEIGRGPHPLKAATSPRWRNSSV
jgi:hypothetical protein